MKKYISDENYVSVCLASLGGTPTLSPAPCSQNKKLAVVFPCSSFTTKVASHTHRILSPQKMGSDALCSLPDVISPPSQQMEQLQNPADDMISDPLE